MSLPLNVKRLLLATVIFVPLGTYVFGIQLIYDNPVLEQERLLKGLLFLAALIGGSATYDLAKKAFFIQERHFHKYFNGVMGGWLAMLCLLTFFIIAGLVLKHPFGVAHIEPWVGHLSLLISLGCIPWLIFDLTRAAEAAAK